MSVLAGIGGIGDALGGILEGVGSIVGNIKGSKTASKALGIQRDIQNRQLDIAETQLAVLKEETDKEREAESKKLNTLLKFYGEQANAERETEAIKATLSGAGGEGGGMTWLLVLGVVLFLLMKK